MLQCEKMKFRNAWPRRAPSHVNIFFPKTRLKRVSFACETLRVNASGRVPSETNEAFGRDLF